MKAIRRWIGPLIFLLSVFNLIRVRWFDSNPTPYRQTVAQQQPKQNKRLLFIVTSINEFDNGRRGTTKGYDRFSKTMLPIMKESITSMMNSGFAVDSVLIVHYIVSDERRKQLSQALPSRIEVWDDATPLGYALEHSKTEIMEVTRALSRQHRFLIKDRIVDYDMFVNFEDDMLIKGDQVSHFMSLTNELYRLRKAAPDEHTPRLHKHEALKTYHGEMTQIQLERCIPGFIRVEAALPNYVPHDASAYEVIPRDYNWNQTLPEAHLDASVCCHVSKETSNEKIPLAPLYNTLHFWETSIDVLGVRKLPENSTLDWLVLLAGNNDAFYKTTKYIVGDYWTGNDFKLGDGKRPDRTKGRYINNQGGWMATKRQMLDWHIRWCRGNFLPPYESPTFPADGLASRTVEFWSGGVQLAGVLSCNLQRVLTLDPDGFSRHLLYHTSNNKQQQDTVRHKFSSRTVDEFWAQLNAVRKVAESKIRR